MSWKKTILCVEDNEDTCELLSFLFQKAGYEVTTCSIPEEGIRLARNNGFGAIILDSGLGGIDGVDMCRIIRTFDTGTPIIFFTGEARPAKKQVALEAGAQAYLIKPNDFEVLLQTVSELINKGVEEHLHEAQYFGNLDFVESKNYRLN